MSTVRAYVESRATDDVRATLEWLDEVGYVLTDARGGSAEAFGNAWLVFTGRCQVVITLERGQWLLDVAPTPGDDRIQYDLLLPAIEGRDYTDYYASFHASVREARAGMKPAEWPRGPEQLPPGVSWRQTLPSVLAWINGPGVSEAVARVADQRYVYMWPSSHKARDIRRRWKRR